MNQSPMHFSIGGPALEERSGTRLWRLMTLAAVIFAATAPSVEAEDLPQLFQRVSKSVVVVRATGRDLAARDGASVLVKYNEVGSGVLASTDGKVLTAAHVVQIADEITVEFLGGERVAAQVIASVSPRSPSSCMPCGRRALITPWNANSAPGSRRIS